MIIMDEIEQLSPAWFQEHAGKPGAGSAEKIITSTGKISTQRKNYLHQMIAEKLLGTKEEGYSNPAMQAGVEREAESRELFEFMFDKKVQQVGMVYKDERKLYLCSPDGLVKENETTTGWVAGLELKNPLAKTHVSYILNGKLPTKYFVQCQMSLFITGLPSWFFMSYYPGIDPFIIEVTPDLKFHEKLEKALEDFCNELLMLLAKVRG